MNDVHDAALQRIADAVERGADEVRIVRNVLDEIRESLSWIVRNGMAVQPVEHVIVLRPPSGVVSTDAAALCDSPAPPGALPRHPPDPQMVDEIVERVGETLAALLTEHLNLSLSALDNVRDRILTALGSSKRPKASPASVPPAKYENGHDPQARRTDTNAAAEAPREMPAIPELPRPTRQGTLFENDPRFELSPASASVECCERRQSVDESELAMQCVAVALPPVTLFEPGDAVTFARDGCEEFGEIVSLDDARGMATVLLIPSMEVVALSQDLLTREEPEDDDSDLV